MSAAATPTTTSVPRRVVGALVLGTLLNPLNSSMIAVALVQIQRDFGVDVVDASWLISSFYLTSAVAQPVTGRLADRLGARRVFMAGLVLVGVAGALAPLSPGFGWVVVARVVLALGASACFPAALAILRQVAGGQPPPRTLAAVSIAGSTSAALGPVLGGALVLVAGWQAVFVVNVLVLAIGLPLALRWLPPDRQRLRDLDAPALRRLADLPGIALFGVALSSALALLLSLGRQPTWWLAPVAAVAGVLFVLRELRHDEPIVDLRALVSDRRLIGVYAQYSAVNIVFYGVFFSVPIWLEDARGFSAGEAGLLMLPIAACGVLATPLAARLISRSGIRPALIAGAAALTAGTLLLLTIGDTTPIVVLVLVGAVLGIPNGFNNLGLQSAMYAAAPEDRVGAAAGIFQMSRFVGAVLSTSLIGIVFASGVGTTGLHQIAIVLAIVSGLVLLGTLRR
jgi:MFS family permease